MNNNDDHHMWWKAEQERMRLAAKDDIEELRQEAAFWRAHPHDPATGQRLAAEFVENLRARAEIAELLHHPEELSMADRNQLCAEMSSLPVITIWEVQDHFTEEQRRTVADYHARGERLVDDE